MEKAFNDFEVWFVTGAQLLYGGDAVKQVDGHSKEMVDGLNNSGLLPVKVDMPGRQTAPRRWQMSCRGQISTASALV